MAGLFTKQAAVYAAARLVYPKDLFAKLAALTAHRSLAWDVSTGNGQAAISVAQHYDSVLAADVSAEQLRHAVPHPKVRYLHTADATPGDDLVAALGSEGCVDLVTVAKAVHWFDLPAFYGVANRVLWKPGGVIAVWGYNYHVSPIEDMMARFLHTTLPYWDSRARYVIDGYRSLPFPFDDVGLGRAGGPRHGARDVVSGARRRAEVVVGGYDGEAAGRRPAGRERGEGAGGRVGRGVANQQGDLQGLPAGRHPLGAPARVIEMPMFD